MEYLRWVLSPNAVVGVFGMSHIFDLEYHLATIIRHMEVRLEHKVDRVNSLDDKLVVGHGQIVALPADLFVL